MRGSLRGTSPEGEVGETRPPEEVFRAFVAARWTALTRYAYLLTGDHQIAEDVVQTALVACWQRWSQIHSDWPEAYVRAAVANAAASRRRKRRHPESSFEDLQERAPNLVAAAAAASAAAAGDVAEEHVARIGMWLALGELAPRMRAVVVLRLWEDRSEAETAQMLGISAGSVKSQLSRGLRQLRENPHARAHFELDRQGER